MAKLDESLMAINRISAWKVHHAFCLMDMSHLVKLTCLMEVPCLKKYDYTTSYGKATYGKKYFHKGIQQITVQVK